MVAKKITPKEVVSIIPSLAQYVVPGDVLDDNSNDKMVLRSLKIGKEVEDLVTLFDPPTQKSEQVNKPVKVVILWSDAVVSCTASRTEGDKAQVCRTNNTKGFSFSGHRCSSCPFLDDKSVKRRLRQVTFMLVDTGNEKFELVKYNPSYYIHKLNATTIAGIRHSVAASGAPSTAAYAVAHLHTYGMPASWDSTIKLAVFSQTTIVDRILGEAEQADVRTLVNAIKEFSAASDERQQDYAREMYSKVEAGSSAPVATESQTVFDEVKEQPSSDQPMTTSDPGPEASPLEEEDDENLPF